MIQNRGIYGAGGWVLVGMFVVLFLAVSAGAQEPSFRIGYPFNGEIPFNIGWSEVITWWASDFSEEEREKLAKLELWQNNRKIGTIKSNLPIQPRGVQSYIWKVGDYQGGTASEGSGYKIRVSTIDGTVWDESDRPFTLRANYEELRIFNIRAPNGGETWNIGERKCIRWQCSGFHYGSSERAKLELWQNNRKIGTIKSNLFIGVREGYYAWTVGDYEGGTASAGSGYKIRMSTMDETVWDASARPFTLRAGPQLQTGPQPGLQTHPPGLQRGGSRQPQH
jgi:hypothetical protein